MRIVALGVLGLLGLLDLFILDKLPGPDWAYLPAGLGFGILVLVAARWPGLARCGLFFLLPLTGALPRLLGVDLPPVALGIFLVVFYGWLLRDWRERGPRLRRAPWIYPVVAALALLGFASGVLAILRYAEFYPFVGGAFENRTVNRLGLTSHAAVNWVLGPTLTLLLGPACFWMLSRSLREEREARCLLLALALGLLPSAALGLYQFLIDPSLGNRPFFAAGARVNGGFLDPNALGGFCVLAAPLLLGLAVGGGRWRDRLAGGAGLAAAVLLVVVSGVRSGILGLFLGLFFYGALEGLSRWRRGDRRGLGALLLALGGGLAVLALAVGILLGSPLREGTALGRRLGETVEKVQRRGPLGMVVEDRWMYWQRGLDCSLRYPLAGIGMGCFMVEIPNIQRWEPGVLHIQDNTTSGYLQKSAELGLPGLALFLMALGLAAARALRLAARQQLTGFPAAIQRGAGAALLTMILLFVLGPHTIVPEPQLLFWTAIALLYAPGLLPGGSLSPPRRGQTGRVAGFALLGLLVVLPLLLQAWRALGPHSLPRRQADRGWEAGSGFGDWSAEAPDGWSRPIMGTASVAIYNDRPRVQFDVQNVGKRPQSLRVLVQGRPVGRFLLEPGIPVTLRLPLPTGPGEGPPIWLGQPWTEGIRRELGFEITPPNDSAVTARDAPPSAPPRISRFRYSGD